MLLVLLTFLHCSNLETMSLSQRYDGRLRKPEIFSLREQKEENFFFTSGFKICLLVTFTTLHFKYRHSISGNYV